ncbi:MAG: ATP-dependent metallopeptidase FtsH/Yme1/Tma family protein, partial [Rhodospirillales bacterium]|nr:ATP-dependent metallopeptidase FtsH/Yme1/Tma family protein [Rhodospirillales bacterium]
MNNLGKNLALWVIIGLLLVALFNLFQQPSERSGQVGIPFSAFLAEVQNGQVREVTIQGNNIAGVYGDGRSFKTYAPNDPNLVERLNKRGVVIKAIPNDDGNPSLFQILISWFPMLLLIGVWI